MIDHILGRPNPSWKRAQVLVIIVFWIWRIIRGNNGPSRFLWLRKLNASLKHFTPYQIILSTLTAAYALRNLDTILGFSAPEPLARLYSPSFYRATWLITGLDAGFATAMSIRPKWLRDICSLIFSVYYIISANSAEEKLRRFRAVPTVEMLRATWEKTTNPYLRFLCHVPFVPVRRKIFIPRPKFSSYARPISAYLFFDLPDDQLCNATELILDFPGGGFVAMNPEHHEERLRIWAKMTRRPILSIDYGKAPEYPYPFAIDEAYDVYRSILDSVGRCIGMSGKSLRIIISGDSAGAVLAVNIVNRILEHRNRPGPCDDAQLPLPVALVLNYAALDFNFTSWMSAENLHVLQFEQSSGNLPGIAELAFQKDHLQHVSPLSMVRDQRPKGSQLQRRRSWKEAIRVLAGGTERSADKKTARLQFRHSTGFLRTGMFDSQRYLSASPGPVDDRDALADAESDEEDYRQWKEEDRPIQARVLYSYDSSTPPERDSEAGSIEETVERVANLDAIQASFKIPKPEPSRVKGAIGTRLTMTSRTGYFQDRIISPSMMRAMAIMYIGPQRNPDFKTDYRISPILTPSHLLAQYPPLLMQCGERDPFVDDTVIFAGRIRESKRARKMELELMISGKSARFGEGLRMTQSDSLDPKALAALKKEQEKLASEREEDWVQMDLFSDWSHGYLQMGALMSESKAVMKELGEWINDAFLRFAPPSAVSCNGDANGQTASRVKMQKPPEYSTTPTPVASASETDAEEESGITFITKKYQDESRRMSLNIPTRGRHALVSVASSSPRRTLSDESAATDKGGRKVQGSENGDLVQTKQEQGQMVDVPKPATPRQAGQTISETELMRRRRLLDSHIFDQEQRV